MPTRNTPRSPAPPRVAEHLDSQPVLLADGVSWSEVDAGPDQSFSGSVSDYEIVGSRLHGVRLTGAVIEGGRWVDVVLDDCELSGTVLDDATLVRVLFHRCRMSSLIATGAKAQDARFVDCKIDGANFRASALERCAFEDCDLTAADFYAARFASGALRRCALADVEFSKATSDGLDLRGSRLEGIKGAGTLQGAVITSDQMVPFGIALLAALGVKVDDGDEPGPG
jgi:uncharacterized protein YjbI with pentapeptide repeats